MLPFDINFTTNVNSLREFTFNLMFDVVTWEFWDTWNWVCASVSERRRSAHCRSLFIATYKIQFYNSIGFPFRYHLSDIGMQKHNTECVHHITKPTAVATLDNRPTNELADNKKKNNQPN